MTDTQLVTAAAPRDPLLVARFLRKQGVPAIPVDHPASSKAKRPKDVGKVPATHRLPDGKWAWAQERVPTDDELQLMFGGPQPVNVAIVTGAVSRLVVVDGDTPEAVAWIESHLPATPLRTRTAKGRHFFYQHPGVPVSNRARINTGDGRLAIDVRGDGGYVLAPGSVHQTGVVYEREGDWCAPDALPVFEPTWLAPVMRAAEAVPAPAEALRLVSVDSLERRVTAYLRAADPAVEGQGGDAHTYALCCRLVRGFALPVHQALDLLDREWNGRCQPPWAREDLRRKLENALRYGDEPVGARLDQGPPSGQGRGTDRRGPATPVPSLTADAARDRLRDAGLVSIGDFLAQDDPAADYLIDNLVARGTINLLVSKPKVGKSVLARAAAVAITQGRPDFLGYAVQPGVVWYLALEGRAQDHRAHFRQLGARESDPLRVFCGQVPQHAINQIRTWAEAEVPDLIVVDTLQRFIRASDTDNYAELSNLFDPIIALSRELGCALLFLHHARKMAEGALSLDAVHGSVAISGSVDNTILLARNGQVRTIATIQRIGTDLEECLLQLDAAGWPQLGASKADAEREAMAVQLLDALRQSATPIVRDDLFDMVEGRAQVKVAALRLLDEARCLDKQGAGVRGNPFRYQAVPGSRFQPAGTGIRASSATRSDDGIPHSCSAVPPKGREQESIATRSTISPYGDGPDSCSRSHAQRDERSGTLSRRRSASEQESTTDVA